jgi:DNA-binding MarR family transcriptional regulator
MEKLSFFDDAYYLWLMLSKTRSALLKARQKSVGRYVHYNLAAGLVTVWALNGKATPATMTRYLFLEPHSVSELVIRMENKGFITKKRDGKRENVVRISITEKGRKFCREAVQPEFVHRIMNSLSREQQKQMAACLNILYREALKELGIVEKPRRPRRSLPEPRPVPGPGSAGPPHNDADNQHDDAHRNGYPAAGL